MEAKDTVINIPQGTEPQTTLCRHCAYMNTQAEISFKAGQKYGIWLFAWWKDGVQYVGTSGKSLREAYKELGLEYPPVRGRSDC